MLPTVGVSTAHVIDTTTGGLDENKERYQARIVKYIA